MSKQPRRAETLDQDLALIGHLEAHLAAISDPTSRLLLSLASAVPITNSDVSRAGGKSRNTTWYQLSKLTGLGMLEKRGHHYRTSPYAVNLIQAAATTFRAVVNGKMPQAGGTAEWSTILKIAAEGTESLYVRGTIDQEEYDKRLKMIHDLETALGHS
jgi:DNA-binding transcriptional ArsR family regulator